MAHTLSALKRIRQTEARRLRNKSEKSRMKTSVKKYLKAVEEGDIQSAETLMKESISLIYRTADKDVVHKNQAARKVSRMVRKLNALKAAAGNA